MQPDESYRLKQQNTPMTMHVSVVPERLDTFRDFIIFIMASLTIERLGISIYNAVHVHIENHSTIMGVITGFLKTSYITVFIGLYLGITTLRYAAAVLTTKPLFRAPEHNVELAIQGRHRTIVAVFDAAVNLLLMTLLFIASEALQKSGASIEVIVWILFAIALDIILCSAWIVILRDELFRSSIGFKEETAHVTKQWNKRWVVINLIEVLTWYFFMRNIQAGGYDFISILLFFILFSAIALDFIFNKDYWSVVVSGDE